MKASTEILTHYRCESCDQLWTIADSTLGDTVFCPRCGLRQRDVIEWHQVLTGGWRANIRDIHCYLHEDGVYSGYSYLAAPSWHWSSIGFDAPGIDKARAKVEELMMERLNSPFQEDEGRDIMDGNLKKNYVAEDN